MLKRYLAVLLILGVLCIIGCSAHVHTVGNGPQGNTVTEARQWYILFGYMPLNIVDTNAIAGEATDYEIRTEQKAIDIIMSLFTGVISVHSRTVTVQK